MTTCCIYIKFYCYQYVILFVNYRKIIKFKLMFIVIIYKTNYMNKISITLFTYTHALINIAPTLFKNKNY